LPETGLGRLGRRSEAETAPPLRIRVNIKWSLNSILPDFGSGRNLWSAGGFDTALVSTMGHNILAYNTKAPSKPATLQRASPVPVWHRLEPSESKASFSGKD
jgi:hypothetical protein